jgi:tetratricopeptide (TPR) repeat protein
MFQRAWLPLALTTFALGLFVPTLLSWMSDESDEALLRPEPEIENLRERLAALEAAPLRRSGTRQLRMQPRQASQNAAAPVKTAAPAPQPESLSEAETEAEEAIEADAAAREARARSTLSRLLDEEATVDEKAAIWRELAGREELALIIAALEERAEAQPQNPDVACDLGSAYASALRGGELKGQERREFTQQAMTQFERALELDEEHWEARFSQSMMQAFAPPALGLAAQARENLETLAEQQRARAPRPEDAHTYFFLANLRAGEGDAAGAAEIRDEASRLFPQDPRFRRPGGRR